MLAVKLISFVALAAPLIAALTCPAPTNWTTASQVNATWTTSSGDPTTFSIELVNPSFNSQLALGNNIPASAGQATLGLGPVAPGDNYQLEFVNVGNISNVYCTSSTFSIAQNPTTSLTSTLTPSSTASNSGTISGSTAAGTLTGSSTTTGTGQTPSTFGNSNGAILVLPSNNFIGFAVITGAMLAGAQFLSF